MTTTAPAPCAVCGEPEPEHRPRCPHYRSQVLPALSVASRSLLREDLPYEPPGHRGHPTHAERLRAASIATRVEHVIASLTQHGFNKGEAFSFILGMLLEVATAEDMERWSSIGGARGTLQGLLDGRAAKHWSMDVIELALAQLEEIL